MENRKFSICVIGSGGTGSYFLKEFSRYLYDNRKAAKQISALSVVDGDRVEKKNISRQAFQEEDIHESKAAVLTSVLNETFDLKWNGYARYLLSVKDMNNFVPLSGRERDTIPVIIGCVDNHAARLVCEEYFNSRSDCIYFDSANEFSSGEVVFAAKKEGKILSPLRSRIFPEILNGDLRSVNELSCTELNEVAPQHICANMQAGLILVSAVTSLLEDGICTTGMTVFDVKQMVSTHYPPNLSLMKEGE